MSRGRWTDDRVETTYREARAVLEAQNETMADIDDKAMQTVRFDTVLVGLLLAATNAAGTSIFHPGLFGAGIVSLTSSILLGLVTYNESDLFVGPSGQYLTELTHGETAERWDVDLLETLAGMIATNGSEIDWNSRLLTATQSTLVLGIVAAVLAVGF